MNYSYTRVYLIDGDYVIADHIADAIALWMSTNDKDEPMKVEVLKDYNNSKKCADVLIKIEENETKN